MQLAARDSTVLSGGPFWEVPVGRKDSRSASLSGSNNNIPAPNSTFQTILNRESHNWELKMCQFQTKALQPSWKQPTRLYLGSVLCCSAAQQVPEIGGDSNLFFLDFVSPTKFDNSYFKLLLANKGLLNSDQVLTTKNDASLQLVKAYAENNELFLQHFASSMIKMANISPLTGSNGEIRKNCRKINS
nr:peroxidase 72-like [Ipomoea batatas]